MTHAGRPVALALVALALLIAPIAGCGMEDVPVNVGSLSAGASTHYWEDAANQQAAAAEGLKTVAVDDGSGRVGVVPQPRHAALGVLRSRLGAEPELPRSFSPQHGDARQSQAPPPVLLSEWMPSGDLKALYYYGPGSLVDCANDCGLAVKAFVVGNKDLFGFAGSNLSAPSQLTSLVQDSAATSVLPSGHKMTVMKFSQTYRGLPIFDGNVTAVFWDKRLVSLTGPIFNAAKDFHSANASLTPSAAAAFASKAVTAPPGSSLECFASSQPTAGRLVWTCQVGGRLVLVSDKDGQIVGTEPLFAAAIPSEGYRVSWCANGDPYCSTANVLRDEYPQAYPWTFVSLNGSLVHPYWAGEVAVYNGRVNFSGAIGFTHKYTSYPDPYAFIEYEDTSDPYANYAMQHVSYWMQKTALVASNAHGWFPPRGSPAGNREVVVIVNDQDPYNQDLPGYTQRACNLPGDPRNLWYDAHEAKPCVILSGDYPLPVGGDAPCAGRWDGNSSKACVWVNSILFHEFGHAQQHLYCEVVTPPYDYCYGHAPQYYKPCHPNTDEETAALSEAIAGLNSMVTGAFHSCGPHAA